MDPTESIGRRWQASHPDLPGEFDTRLILFTVPTQSGLTLGWTPYAFGQVRIKMMRPSQFGGLPEIMREL